MVIAIALTQANISQLNSVIDRGASRYAVGGHTVSRRTVGRCAISRYTIRREYTDAKGALS